MLALSWIFRTKHSIAWINVCLRILFAIVDLNVFRELCRKAASETDLGKLLLVKEQMKVLLSNDSELPIRTDNSDAQVM